MSESFSFHCRSFPKQVFPLSKFCLYSSMLLPQRSIRYKGMTYIWKHRLQFHAMDINAWCSCHNWPHICISLYKIQAKSIYLANKNLYSSTRKVRNNCPNISYQSKNLFWLLISDSYIFIRYSMNFVCLKLQVPSISHSNNFCCFCCYLVKVMLPRIY